MKIGIDVSYVNNDQKTGVEWYVVYLLEKLKKIIPKEYEVILYTSRPLLNDLAINLPENWKEKILSWPPKIFWTQLRLSFEMFFHKPDIFFVPAHVCPFIHPKNTIVTIHDIASLRFPKSYSKIENWYYLWSVKFALKSVAKVIVPSNFTKKEIGCLNLKKELLEKIKVVYHGFNEIYQNNFSDVVKKNILNKYNIGSKFLLSISRLEYKKNTLGIVKAFEILKKQEKNKDLQLVLVGKPGFGFEEVRDAIQTSSYKKDIVLPGWVEEGDLPIILSAAQIFVFPSLYEGFGLPILQAMSAGVPVVTSGSSSLPEVGNEACLYVDPANYQDIVDKVEIFLTDKKLRQEKIVLGKKRAKDFSWEKCAKETFELLIK
ncbi:MAG: hypothetical protein A2493_03375 [Candidatus Magasanikbacteria bacterium RIFOXYC12_FULL_33_11]|uniref:Glycosyl transferase family 1 domain-containing protein n=1 Tax=Candidatus Magasanikbacteria bacterium RIFOXYC12_FULL_33_11 TaxID=1798701 RepID=A0A1F6NNL9_9BACT|nr:MAG: hypothetical protein A2493_03375 [Candidatus Magasanikbacteria bacterium RIFOXYC12_FULL_33_11]